MKKAFQKRLKSALGKVKNNNPTVKYAYGPLNKSAETGLFETIITSVIADQEQVSLRSYALKKGIVGSLPDPDYRAKVSFTKRNNQLWVTMHEQGDREINVTELLKKVNLNHVQLPDAALKQYEGLISNNPTFNSAVKSRQWFKKRIKKADLVQREYLPQLSHAEMLAINSYTSENYKEMNGILRGTVAPTDPAKTLMDIAIASQGLNKIPDIELPAVTRFQTEYGLNKMIKQAQNNEVEEIAGFISTSFKPMSEFGSVQIIYENVKGKSISALSEYPKEREYLIPPNTQIKFTGHEVINGRHVFSAAGANVLLDQAYEITPANKAIEEIDNKINNLSTESKENTHISEQGIKQFMKDCVKIAYKHGLINKNILDKYTKEQDVSDLPDKPTFKKLGVRDKFIYSVSIVAGRLGLKSLSSKLKNKLSPEGGKIIETEQKKKELYKEAQIIGEKLKLSSTVTQETTSEYQQGRLPNKAVPSKANNKKGMRGAGIVL